MANPNIKQLAFAKSNRADSKIALVDMQNNIYIGYQTNEHPSGWVWVKVPEIPEEVQALPASPA